jgi:nucleoside-diphosphate-sugar epimerase
MKTKHIIVTGAYGLIGSNFCKTIPSDWEVTKVKGLEIPPFTEMADYIIHGAGYGQPQKFLQDEIGTIKVNTEMTLCLFETYLKPDGKFLFLSTSEVYSGLHNQPFKENKIGTTTPKHQRACYIESKRCGEAICMAQRRLGVDAKVARLSLIYGEGTKRGDTRVLNQFIEQALTKNKIEILDKGTAFRTYCYIDDAIKILWDILLKGKEPIYNVGGFSETTILNLANLIGEIVGVPVIVPKENKKLAGSPERVVVDMNKVLNEFGYDKNNFISLVDGLRKTIQWQKKELYS